MTVIQREPPPLPGPFSLCFPTVDDESFILPSPYRGTLIVGAPGTGKTCSLALPMATQLAAYELPGLAYSAVHSFPITEVPRSGPLARRHLDFYDFGRSEKVNPLHPSLLDSAQDAAAVASSLLGSLVSPAPGPVVRQNNFFTQACASYLAGIIWYYRQHHPQLCTLPHVLATVHYADFTRVLSMLSQDEDCLALVQGMVTAVKQGAEKQIAGLVAALHVDTIDLLYPELVWLLCPDEAQGEGFSLRLNDPAQPTQLTISTHPELARAFAPVISCVIGAALKQLVRPGQLPSYAVLDDAQTLYLPDLVALSATARRNELALVYVLSDVAQLIAVYGIDSAQWLLTNMGNHFFGEPASLVDAMSLAEYVKSDLIAPPVFTGNRAAQTGFAAEPGEFVGQLDYAGAPIFQCHLRLPPGSPLPARADRPDVSEALSRAMNEKLALVHRQVAETLGGYPNGLSRENRQGQ